jgi:hypothetical protein
MSRWFNKIFSGQQPHQVVEWPEKAAFRGTNLFSSSGNRVSSLKRRTLCNKVVLNISYSRTPLIQTLVIRTANYPDRLGPSGKFVENSTKLTCLEITGYLIKYSTVL